VSPQTWQFETNPYGRPYISQPQALRHLRFNSSNTTGLVACAVSNDSEIGIDVENFARTVDTDALAPSVLPPLSWRTFANPGRKIGVACFSRTWTLKESYIKARGMGLSIPLDAFWFRLGGPVPLLYVTTAVPTFQNDGASISMRRRLSI